MMQIESVTDANRIAASAEHACSPLYRPPELYEPPTRGIIDGRVDIWALGCLLYFMMMRIHPFEKQCMQGASLVLAVQRAKVDWSGAPEYLHPDLKELVHACLRPKLEERPTSSELRQWIGRIKQWIGR
jgi:serine/threonine protein kinase